MKKTPRFIFPTKETLFPAVVTLAVVIIIAIGYKYPDALRALFPKKSGVNQSFKKSLLPVDIMNAVMIEGSQRIKMNDGHFSGMVNNPLGLFELKVDMVKDKMTFFDIDDDGDGDAVVPVIKIYAGYAPKMNVALFINNNGRPDHSLAEMTLDDDSKVASIHFDETSKRLQIKNIIKTTDPDQNFFCCRNETLDRIFSYDPVDGWNLESLGTESVSIDPESELGIFDKAKKFIDNAGRDSKLYRAIGRAVDSSNVSFSSIGKVKVIRYEDGIVDHVKHLGVLVNVFGQAGSFQTQCLVILDNPAGKDFGVMDPVICAHDLIASGSKSSRITNFYVTETDSYYFDGFLEIEAEGNDCDDKVRSVYKLSSDLNGNLTIVPFSRELVGCAYY